MSTQPAGNRNLLDLASLGWDFGDRLRKIRKAAGITQTELADILGCGAKSLAAWEIGTNTPRNIVSIAKRIEMAYGVPAAWTLGIVPDPGPEGPGSGGGGVRDVAPRPGLEPGTLWIPGAARFARSLLRAA